MIPIWIARQTNNDVPLQHMHPQDIRQADLKKSSTRKTQFLLARSVLRTMLRNETGQDDWKIVAEPNGKPYIIDTRGNRGPHLSISHTRGMVACALSPYSSIGIDIEQWKPRQFSSIAAFSFGVEEQQQVKEKGLAEFYKIWTLREAISKCTGDGLKLVTNGVDLVSGVDEGYHRIHHYQLYSYSPEQGYSLAVAVLSNEEGKIQCTIKSYEACR